MPNTNEDAKSAHALTRIPHHYLLFLHASVNRFALDIEIHIPLNVNIKG